MHLERFVKAGYKNEFENLFLTNKEFIAGKKKKKSIS